MELAAQARSSYCSSSRDVQQLQSASTGPHTALQAQQPVAHGALRRFGMPRLSLPHRVHRCHYGLLQFVPLRLSMTWGIAARFAMEAQPT